MLQPIAVRTVRLLQVVCAITVVSCSDAVGPPQLATPDVKGSSASLERWATSSELDDLYMMLGDINRAADPMCNDIYAALETLLNSSTNHFKYYDSTENGNIPGYCDYCTNSTRADDVIGLNSWDMAGLSTENPLHILIHEGAHSAGYDDSHAYWAESLCKISDMRPNGGEFSSRSLRPLNHPSRSRRIWWSLRAVNEPRASRRIWRQI
jgi:hypothetical protein